MLRSIAIGIIYLTFASSAFGGKPGVIELDPQFYQEMQLKVQKAEAKKQRERDEAELKIQRAEEKERQRQFKTQQAIEQKIRKAENKRVKWINQRLGKLEKKIRKKDFVAFAGIQQPLLFLKVPEIKTQPTFAYEDLAKRLFEIVVYDYGQAFDIYYVVSDNRYEGHTILRAFQIIKHSLSDRFIRNTLDQNQDIINEFDRITDWGKINDFIVLQPKLPSH